VVSSWCRWQLACCCSRCLTTTTSCWPSYSLIVTGSIALRHRLLSCGRHRYLRTLAVCNIKSPLYRLVASRPYKSPLYRLVASRPFHRLIWCLLSSVCIVTEVQLLLLLSAIEWLSRRLETNTHTCVRTHMRWVHCVIRLCKFVCRPTGELGVNAGVVWLAGNTVWSTPERIRGEVLTTMRYTNWRLPYIYLL